MTTVNPPFKVIVNADDFGMSVWATDQIVACIDAGQVTSTTVMANGPDLGRALGLAADRPRASFGVHLNATQFKPLTTDDRLAPLLTDGELNLTDRSVLRSRHVRAALTEEFSAQVRAVQAGIRVSHLDSHHMIHWWPELLPVIKAVARSTGVDKVRTVESWIPLDRSVRLKRRLWRHAMTRLPTLIQTDEFQALQTFVEVADSLPDALTTVELMVHPGHPEYAEETEILLDGWQRHVKRPISLITFDQLGS